MTKIEPIVPEDYQDIARFLAKTWNRDPKFWLQRFDFMWDKNPAFPQDPHRGFVVKKDGDIAGFIGYFPSKFQLDGQETIAANGIGLMLAPELKGSGLGVKLKYKHAKLCQDKIAFATSPNKMSQKINAKLGYELLPRGIGDYNLYSLFPINKPRSLELFIRMLGSSRSIQKAAPFSINAANILTSRYLQNTRDGTSEFKIKKITHAGMGFDKLWDETKGLYKNTNVRSAEIINWYLLPTQYANRDIYVSYRNKELTGYIIVRKSIFKKILFLLCTDLCIEPENQKNTLRNLISFAQSEAKNRKCQALLVPHFSKDINDLLSGISCVKVIGCKRNDLFLDPRNHNYISEQNSYFTYMNGDRFMGYTPI